MSDKKEGLPGGCIILIAILAIWMGLYVLGGALEAATVIIDSLIPRSMPQERLKQRNEAISTFQEDQSKRMLAPEWYKKSIVYCCSSAGKRDWVFGVSSIRWAITLLASIVICFYQFSQKEKNPFFATLAIMAATEIAIPFAYLALWVIVFIAYGDHYIPTGLIACMVYGFSIITLPISLLARNMSFDLGFRKATISAVVETSRVRRKSLVSVAIRALIVSVITTLGSQLGGWIGSIVAVVVSSVIVATLGGGHWTQPDQDVGHHE